MKNSKKVEYLTQLLTLIIGCFIMAVGLNMFLEPYTIASGGLTGLAIIFNKIWGVQLWVINLVFNIPLFIFGIKILGKKDSIKTFIGIMFLTYFLGITAPLADINATKDVLLASIAGGIIVGISLGLLFRIDASTGGTELACLIINRLFPSITISKLMFIIDGIVIVLAGIVDKKIETALYAALSLYISVKVSDAIIEGFDYSKAFMIVTDKPDELSDIIMEVLGRGVTLLQGKGAYTRQEKDVVFVVVSRKEEVTLKRLVKEIDPVAFTIVSNVHEVLGEGFKAMNV